MQNFGVMLFKDIIIKENLLKYYTLNESNFLYKKRIQELKSKGYTIDAIVSDVRKVFVQSFGAMPFQT
jgi:hypothetical protein